MLEIILSPYVPLAAVIFGVSLTITSFIFIPRYVYTKAELYRFRLAYITGIIIILASVIIAAIGFNTFPDKYIPINGNTVSFVQNVN